MIELLQITNDPEFAQRCDALEGVRIFVDLERLGKAQRQAGRNTFISAHEMADVGRVRQVLRRSRLMVRVNPPNPGTQAEIDEVIRQGADSLMLPMFTSAAQLREFCVMVAGRVPVIPLLETSEALESLDEWIGTPGLGELFMGLNDLHVSLGCRFMFEPLAMGLVDRVASAARARGLRFGFGGIARLDEGLLPGRDVLAEHLRLGSSAVILSRTFHGAGSGSFEADVLSLRQKELQLSVRSVQQMQADRDRIHETIRHIAARAGRAA